LQPFTPQELIFARAGHGIDGPLLDHAAKGDTLTLAGVDEVAGGKAFHLVAQLAKGGKEDVWVDAKTYLEVRYDRMADGPTPGASRRVSVAYGDYRTIEGLTMPFRIETGVGSGTTPDKMQIDKVVLNAPLDDSTFSNPARVPARQRERSGGPTPALTATPSMAPTAASGAPGPAPR
jgi:hypothetical protein